MMQSFEDFNKVGKEFVDTGLKSVAALSKSMQEIAAETTEYTKKSYEAGSAALEKLLSARSVETAFEVQTDYAKSAYEGFVAEATKIGELYADMAKEMAKPFESAMAKAR